MYEQNNDYLAKTFEFTKDMKVLDIILSIYEKKNDKEKQKYFLSKMLNLQPKNVMVKVKLAKIYLE